ncbi:MAG TPA: TonB-dependent receptor [Chitinophagaceae bacterium]|nr:TonB-dependent receptor [Chitinophagaceae bacterium]
MKRILPPLIRALLYSKSFLKTSVLFLSMFCCMVMITNAIHAQNVTVKGSITSQTGEPLSGVSVKVKNSAQGTATDANGFFQIDVPQNSTLVFSYVGYISKEVKASSSQSNLSLQLLTDKNELSQVIVVGYGTRKKSDVTGAITSISEQSIKDVPASNLASAIQGQGAGVDIQRSGANSKPGATPNILIRGSRSLTASNSPLIVVDGIPFNGNINDLNQDDVSSVEILKDASSTAIYGSRGANGVILITTKRGRSAKPVFTYSGYAGQTRLIREFPVMNADEFTLLKKWANINGNPGKYTGLDDPLFLTNGVFAPEEVEGLKIERNTDWQSYIYKTGIMTDHQLGISGGTDITQYAISGGYFNQTGIYKGQQFERFTVKMSLDQQLGKRFKIGLSSLNTYSKRSGESANPMAQALRASPLVSPFDSTGAVLNDFVPGSASQVWNPLADLIPGAVAEERKRLGTFTTLFVEVNLYKGLKYKFNSGVEVRNDSYNNYYSGKTSFRVNQGGAAASNRNNNNTNYTIENLLTYDKTFLQKHKLNFTGLYSIQESKTISNQFDYNINSDYLAFYNAVYGSNIKPQGSYSKWDIISYMGRINYSFDDRYLLTLTMRSDGSSRLAPGNKWHTFPSAAAAWNIARESFFSNVQKINNLKLRASYGTVGNTAISPYQTLGALSPIVYNFGSSYTTGAYFSNASNDSLTWENTSTANIGLDFGLFSNRISGSIEVYKQFTSSLLLSQTLPITSGIPNAIVRNVGKTENKGLEIHISTVNIQGRTKNDFTWTSDLNFFLNRGKITQLANGATRDVANGWFVGQPIDVYYDFKRNGIWQNTPEDTAEAKRLGLTVTGSGSVIGTIRVADVSGPDGKPDGKIDQTYDRIIVGTAEPKWEGGATQRFSYKGFDLTVVAFARWGYTLNSSLYGGNFVNTYQGIYNNLKTDYWTPFNHQNKNPKPNSNNTNPINRSVLSYFDGSFIKIRSMSLGYNLPSSIIQKVGGRSLRVYAIATDPFILFSPYRKIGGIDPEGAGTVGIDTPPVWSLTFGLNLSF